MERIMNAVLMEPNDACHLIARQPEGNLFKDRFQSLQERSLIEPRVPVG
jgi:hypothetical protein